jgi:hypothetical protein
MNRRDVLRSFPALLSGRLRAGGSANQSGPIRTGLKEFDDLTGGLPPGSLTVLYGQFKAGKTTLAMNVAEHVAVEEGRPVLYLLQKFNAQTLFSQIACSRARVDFLDFAEGKLSADEESRCKCAERELSSTPLTIDDTPHLSRSEVVRRIEIWAKEHPSGVAIVDHIDGNESEREADGWSHALKSVAARTGTVVLAISYLIEVSLEGEAGEAPVSTSHADFSWQLLRFWCWNQDANPRDEAHLGITDRRTGEHRLALDLQLDEKFRRFQVVRTSAVLSSLRDERETHPSGTVYHRILKPGEEPPAGSRLIYLRGLDPELEITGWESSNWEV